MSKKKNKRGRRRATSWCHLKPTLSLGKIKRKTKEEGGWVFLGGCPFRDYGRARVSSSSYSDAHKLFWPLSQSRIHRGTHQPRCVDYKLVVFFLNMY